MKKSIILKVIVGILITAIIVAMAGCAYVVLRIFSNHFYNLNESISSVTQSIKNFDTMNSAQVNKELESSNNILNDSLADDSILLDIAGKKYTINCQYAKANVEFDELYTGKPIPVTFKTAQDVTVKINGEDFVSGDSLVLDKIGKSSYITIEITDGVSERCYDIATLPSDFPTMKLTGQYKSDKAIYGNTVTTVGDTNNYVYKMSLDGEILYYYRTKHTLMNFAKWELDSGVYYTYFEQIPEYTSIELGGVLSEGVYKILDENYNVIKEVSLEPSVKHNISEKYVESHDFYLISPEHYISMAYVAQTPKAQDITDNMKIDTRVYGAYIQEVNKGEVTFEWLSTDHPEFYAGARQSNDYINQVDAPLADYMHVNSIFVDPKDNNIILSFRQQDCVIKLDRNTEEIIWTLGGDNDDFGITEEQNSSRQHHATYNSEGNLMLFDNGNANNKTRILEYTLDEENKKLLNFKESSLDTFSVACGSVQKLSDTSDIYCIGWGIRNGENHIMSIVDFTTGEMISELFSDNTYSFSYRVGLY